MHSCIVVAVCIALYIARSHPPLFVQVMLSAAFPDHPYEFLHLVAASMAGEQRRLNADRKLMRASVYELPLVTDVVEAINASSDTQEKQRLLSVLANSFTRAELNNDRLGLREEVSRRMFYAARSHLKAFGAGASAPELKKTSVRLRVSTFESAMKHICSVDNMHVLQGMANHYFSFILVYPLYSL